MRLTASPLGASCADTQGCSGGFGLGHCLCCSLPHAFPTQGWLSPSKGTLVLLCGLSEPNGMGCWPGDSRLWAPTYYRSLSAACRAGQSRGHTCCGGPEADGRSCLSVETGPPDRGMPLVGMKERRPRERNGSGGSESYFLICEMGIKVSFSQSHRKA